MNEYKKIIFIACGQRENREKELGKRIVALIESRGNFKPFLAEVAHSFNALTSEIFENLNHCVGFIAILHRREKIEESNIFRSSVWINQEIAIASFLRLRDKRDIPVRIFIESKENTNVKTEGVLEYIMANSIPFSKDEEVVEKINEWMDKTIFPTKKIAEDYLLGSKSIIKLLPGDTGELHTYRLDLEIANMGVKTVKDISLDFYFPEGIPINESSTNKFVKFDPKGDELDNYYGFRLKNNISKILPGKSEQIYCFDFQVDHVVYHAGHTHKKLIWTIFADDMSPINGSAPLKGAKGEGINF